VSSDVHERIASHLRSLRSGDGFGPRAGVEPEPEPTALAAIALDDGDARGWLESHQADDGGLAIVAGSIRNDSATAIAGLALGGGLAGERALDHVIASRARSLPADDAVPHDPNVRGWGWTPDTFGWVEPTSAVLLALRVLRPRATTAIAEGLALLADRECLGGGWNYGNPVVYDDDLPPFVHTTAVATIALQGDPAALGLRGVDVLRSRWPDEPGGLSLSTTLAAFELVDPGSARPVEAALAAEFDRTGLMDDVVSLAWAAIATGPGLERLRWRR
jgi:hypothetical protein